MGADVCTFSKGNGGARLNMNPGTNNPNSGTNTTIGGTNNTNSTDGLFSIEIDGDHGRYRSHGHAQLTEELSGNRAKQERG